MPRCKRFITQDQEELRDLLKREYRGMMTLTDVGHLISTDNKQSIKNWLQGVPSYDVNGHKKWMTRDVADRLFERRNVCES